MTKQHQTQKPHVPFNASSTVEYVEGGEGEGEEEENEGEGEEEGEGVGVGYILVE